ncbi:12-oxophytodienoate reductase 1 [Cyanobium sp. PCC 7001]|nr:12-oxophytodienoate reductase 1 [Cyanobium sp. PCC 7001]
MAAGFDGVEVHGANGYQVDQVLRDSTNHRSDPYGGPLHHRARLLLVGLRLSPLNSFNDSADSDPIGVITWLVQQLNDLPLAYLHLMHGDVLTTARERIRRGAVLNAADPATFYSPGPVGYTDYPTLAAA